MGVFASRNRKRAAAGAALLVAAAAAGSCALERRPYLPDPRPGVPAYWESSLPPSATEAVDEDGGASDAPMDGAAGEKRDAAPSPPPPEKYLWEDPPAPTVPVIERPPPPGPPDSQIPLRDDVQHDVEPLKH